MFKPRPGQIEVVKYDHGKMGVTAVPGSGKTETLSYLAAKLVASDLLDEDQEVLIVTLVNSAVNNFSSRISRFLGEFGLIPGLGYRVRTLHGLAYDIVREQPYLAGLDNQFSIADERASSDMLTLSSTNWMRLHEDILADFTPEDILPAENKKQWSQLIQNISNSYIKLAKNLQLTPSMIQEIIEKQKITNDLLLMGNHIYSEYQRSLNNRASVDFDDLIRLAYQILVENPDFLHRLQMRWPIILEDEAQDSSSIQEKMLSLLTESKNNWVRVGDPNQAIYETFTTANPELLRSFMKLPNVNAVSLPHSGRSTRSIIKLANYLIKWTRNDHPITRLRNALDEPFIIPTPENDPQPNPVDAPDQIYFFNEALSPEKEIKLVARSVEKWIGENPAKTVAILVPRNHRGAEMVEELTNRNVPYVELLSSSKAARDAAVVLHDILQFFAFPNVKRHLTSTFFSIMSALDTDGDIKQDMPTIKEKLNSFYMFENLFSQPDGVNDIVLSLNLNDYQQTISNTIFDKLVSWQRTVLLPIDQMIITISSDLFTNPSDLALAHKIAVILKKSLDYYPEWQLPDFCGELEAITKNRYRLFGFSDEDLGFDPDQYKGKVLVATLHKAKGLEWDRVYLMSINNYNFPSAAQGDSYYSEKWFVQDHRNLEAETLASLSALVQANESYDENLIAKATQKARIDYCAERLRLLYVGITRAREQLIFTWNTGRKKDCVEALPLQSLRKYWEDEYGKQE